MSVVDAKHAFYCLRKFGNGPLWRALTSNDKLSLGQ
ncbi:hypothetical protein PS833_00774 [Pseudomonas fluorescens]|uniref:Uncharacterized protein n=1 Tax=Pseudomonas fluorescens TaxID=294 RepID=A0A5E7ADI6_PSEFL|nr:hypothetical protein PS833_00774 [Pseudomonas fluorescens]